MVRLSPLPGLRLVALRAGGLADEARTGLTARGARRDARGIRLLARSRGIGRQPVLTRAQHVPPAARDSGNHSKSGEDCGCPAATRGWDLRGAHAGVILAQRGWGLGARGRARGARTHAVDGHEWRMRMASGEWRMASGRLEPKALSLEP